MNIGINHPSANLARVEINGVLIYFSYDTVIGFKTSRGRVCAAQNEWSATTAKHLTMLDGGERDERIPHKQMLNELSIELTREFMEAARNE